MGKIVKDGIDYGATVPHSKNLKYDNTNSGLESTNIQDAIDEVNSKTEAIDIEWKHWKTVSGSNIVTLPEDFNELHIRVVNITNIVGYVFNLLKSDCKDDYRYRNGYYTSTTAHSIVSVKVNSTSLQVDTFILNGNNVLGDIEVVVSYR